MLPTPINQLNQQNTQQTESSNSNTTAAKTQQKNGTGFTNIGRMLQANQGAGQRMGQKIGSSLSNQAGVVNQGVQAGNQVFTADMNKNRQAQQSKINSANNFVNSNTTDNPSNTYINMVGSADQNQIKQIGQDLRGTSYSGPSGIKDDTILAAKAQTVDALGRLAGNQAGQAQLLRSQVANRGNYTQGQNTLDQLLLGKEGQGSIQKGAASTYGIQDRTNSIINSAKSQAQEATKAIDTNRTKTMQDLNTNINQIQKLGEDQAAQFNKDAGRLQELLGGTAKNITEDDERLLDRAKEFGIDTNSIYEGRDPMLAKIALSNLASTKSSDFGNRRFIGNQSQAAQNLAELLGDQTRKSDISSNKFNEDAFNADESNIFNALSERKQRDIENQNTLKSLANQAEQYENYKKQFETLANRKLTDQDYFMGSQENVKNLSKEVQDAYLNAVNMRKNSSLGSSGEQYNWAQYGDQSATGDFSGLGLDAGNVDYGTIRSSEQLKNAANRAVGNDMDLRHFILKNLYNTGSLIDPKVKDLSTNPKTIGQV